jgi:DNA polymerase III alpha subunit
VINTHYNSKEDGEAFPIFQKCGALRGGMSYEVDYAPNMYTKTAEEVWNTFKQFHESEIFTEQMMRDLFFNLENLCKSFEILELDTTPKTPHFENSNEQLREHTMKGFIKYGFDKKGDKYKERIDYELDNICRAGFADYFLLIEQMFDWHINKMGRLSSTGRGSAGGSLVLRCLGATKIDPIEHNLLFERFLDASRLDEIINQGGKLSGADFPDVDNDYPSNAKESVKDFFAETYGKDNICSVGTIGYLHVKSTLKELGRVFDINDKEINVLTTEGLKEFEADDDGLPLDELQEKFPALKTFLEKYPQVSNVFKNLQGTINCWGVHAGGILISDKSLLDQLPVRVNKGKLASCWSEGLNGRELGEMGFLKLDLLAIETLDIIEDAINLINSRHPDANINFDKIPLDEPHALGRIENKENLGVFQFETPLALRVCKDMGGLRKFDDIASLSTLMRPAALQNKFGEKYGKRRDGKEEYFIPDCMKPYISNEYGMPIYQEGAYFFAMYMAGLDKVESYRFMKILYKGKMKGDKIPYWHDKFINGCMKKIKHQEYEIELENGEKRVYTEYDKIKCIDGNEYTIQEIIDNNYEISDN